MDAYAARYEDHGDTIISIPTTMTDWVIGLGVEHIKNIRPVGNVITITNRKGDMYGCRVQRIVGDIIFAGRRTTVQNHIEVVSSGRMYTYTCTQQPWDMTN